MPKIKMIGKWSSKYYTDHSIPKTLLVINPDPVYKKNLGKVLHALDEKQKRAELEGKDDPLQDLEIIIEYHYGKRTVDQNRLLFSINQIEADEMNAGITGDKSQMVTAEEIYYQDGFDNNPHYVIECSSQEMTLIHQKYYTRFTKVKVFEALLYEEIERDGVKRIRLEAVERTSELDKMRMSKRIEMCFNRMAVNGIPVTNSGEILKYLQEHRQYLNDNNIILYDDVMDQAQYKSLHPICEGCLTQYVGDGSGQLAHIKARGMGGKDEKEPEKNFASNWLHLCSDCHIEHWHKKGITSFLKAFPHLKMKVTRATKRDYEWDKLGPIQETPTIREKHGQEQDQNIETAQNTTVPNKIDSEAITSVQHIWFHPESESIFIGPCNENNSEPLFLDLGECKTSEELKKNILEAVEAGASKTEACGIFEKLGWDATEIDPEWIGIF